MLFEDLSSYALGHQGFAGVALISGDAGGFDHINEPLSEEEIYSILQSYLKGEEAQDEDDEALLEGLFGQCEDSTVIADIHARHVSRFSRR